MISLHLTSRDDDLLSINWRSNAGLLHALATRLHGEGPWIHSYDWSDGTFRISFSGTYQGAIVPEEQTTLSVELSDIELIPINDYEFQIWGIATDDIVSSDGSNFSVLMKNTSRKLLLLHSCRQCPMFVPDGKGGQTSHAYQIGKPIPLPDDPTAISLLPYMLGKDHWTQKKAHKSSRLSIQWWKRHPSVQVIYVGDGYLHAQIVSASRIDNDWADAPRRYEYFSPAVIPMLIQRVEYIGRSYPEEIRIYGTTGHDQKPELLLSLTSTSACRFYEEHPDLMDRFLIPRP